MHGQPVLTCGAHPAGPQFDNTCNLTPSPQSEAGYPFEWEQWTVQNMMGTIGCGQWRLVDWSFFFLCFIQLWFLTQCVFSIVSESGVCVCECVQYCIREWSASSIVGKMVHRMYIIAYPFHESCDLCIEATSLIT